LLPDFIGNCLGLPRIRRCADYKEVGEGGYFAEIKNEDVFCFLLFGNPRGDEPTRRIQRCFGVKRG
jgi:hypothetical protein